MAYGVLIVLLRVFLATAKYNTYTWGHPSSLVVLHKTYVSFWRAGAQAPRAQQLQARRLHQTGVKLALEKDWFTCLLRP